jgi:hypothetical protein
MASQQVPSVTAAPNVRFILSSSLRPTPMISGRPPTLHNLSISNLVNLHSLDNDFHFLDNHFLDSVCSCSLKAALRSAR